jgi:prepilin signal peptidase PulO-like enzyme (type II secretory pathway)
MQTALAILLGAIFFAAAGYLGAMLGTGAAQRIPRFSDAPPSFTPPVALLVGGCAVLGAYAATHLQDQMKILLVAVLCVVLVAIWVTDARRGVVPDAFTLAPLALLVLIFLVRGDWTMLAAAAIPIVPFVIAALLSRGRGMGWGDVKLVALGSVVLGWQLAILAFTAACFAAAVVSFVRGRKRGAIAFAPYLATAIGAALPIGMSVR